MTSTLDHWLLPDGIDEFLPPQAETLERLRRELLDLYQTWGYEQVFPPLLEYLESLLTGAGNDLALQTFKLTDQLTGRLLGLRADMTPQVARIDAHTLNRSSVTRLCYAGHVSHAKPENLTASRSLIQIGAEIFGHAGMASDIEVLGLMIETLSRAGCQDLHLDLGHVAIYRTLVAEASLSAEQERTLFDIFKRKAVPELEAFLAEEITDERLQRDLRQLVTLAGEKSVLEQAQQQLAGASAPIQQALDDLTVASEAIAKLYPQVTLFFDLSELRGYHYHTGLVFSAYLPGQGQAIANGGRYDHIGEVFGRARPATGFSTDLAQLVRFAQPAPNPQRIFAPYSDDPGLSAQVAQLRASGHRVVQALDADQTPQALDCNQQLVSNASGWTLESLIQES